MVKWLDISQACEVGIKKIPHYLLESAARTAFAGAFPVGVDMIEPMVLLSYSIAITNIENKMEESGFDRNLASIVRMVVFPEILKLEGVQAEWDAVKLEIKQAGHNG